MMLQYLLAMPQDTASSSSRLLRRRESLMLLTKSFREDDQIDPSLFSLIDLILNSLRSNNPQSVTAALRLVSVILSKNHAYAIGTLVKVSFVGSKEVQRTHGSLNAEMEAYLELAKTTGDTTGIDEMYENHLKDALKLLESHACSAQLLKLDELGFAVKRTGSNLISMREPTTHHINPDGSMLRFLLYNLESFLTNNVEVNLGLTETIITLASCGHLRLEGWVSVEPSKYVFSDATSNTEATVTSASPTSTLNDHGSENKDQIKALELARQRPNWYRRNSPPLLVCLNAVHKELVSVRGAVPDFDILLGARRQAFNLYDAISEAIANAPPPLPSRDKPPALPPRPQQPTPLPQTQGSEGKSFAERMLADFERTVLNPPGTPTRSGQGLQRGLNLAQRMLSDYEKSIGGDGAIGRSSPVSSSVRSPRTPRSQSRPRPTPAPNFQDSRGLGSYGMVGAQSPSPRTPQSMSRAQSPMPGAHAHGQDPRQKGRGKDPKALLNDVIREADAEVLKRRFQFPTRKALAEEDREESDTASVASREQSRDRGSGKGKAGDKRGVDSDLREASLSHILTNAVILQEFELELVAIMQVRASIFGEVRFA